MAHEHFKSCIDACNDCALACDHCASACLKEKDVASMARCIQLDLDCAQACRLAVAYMARGSEFAARNARSIRWAIVRTARKPAVAALGNAAAWRPTK
jgi:hypothetical protein